MRKMTSSHIFLLAFVVGILVGIGAALISISIRKPPPQTQLPLQYYPKESYVRIASPSALLLPIIMYHYVESIKDPEDKIRNSLTINPYLFEQQLKVLAENNFTTYFVKEIPALLEHPEKVASQSIALTFDDGYDDFYSVVFPLLEKYKIKGTVYVISGFTGYRGFLSEKQLKELAQSKYIEIGAHTVGHAYLKGMPAELVSKQIENSTRSLEEITEGEIKTFAYPYGAFDTDSIEAAKHATISAAVSVIPGAYHSQETKYFLYRIRAGRLGSGEYMLQFLESLKNEATPAAPVQYP